ncbi:uncharacterized protein vir-1 isoform X2 [Drosophila pseudoobscura]|uniref:Uncharacterized protein vir-1 isoform X2 n=1 Tax=Drosophila pseudoobscura pseudoobscura TaxID=46245 RepID=A0A6I8UKB8_DROPS|nr:uncharacterized protein LOC4817021 isoform X2 [Drosophila pseudoobscura]
MKLLLSALLIALALSGVLTLPARNNPQDDAEVIKVPSRPQSSSAAGEPDFHNFGGVIDTGAGYPFLQSNPTSFNTGFFDSFDDLFRRLRTRLWPVIATDSSEDGAGAGAGADDSGDGIGSGFSFGLRPLTPLNPKNGNTTSTVKVVDGHKVEINETVYGDTNSLFKVRVVNVRPLDSGEEVAEGVLTSQGDFQPAAAPATSAPAILPTRRGEFDNSDDDDNSRREPLEKQPKDNEVRDIDEPQSTTTTTPRYTTTKLATSSPADSVAEGTDLEINKEIMANLDTESSMFAAVEAKGEAEELFDSQKQEQEEFEAVEKLAEDSALFEDADLVHRLAQLQHREREELESSDDEDGEAIAPVEMSETFNEEWETLDQDQEQDQNEVADDQDRDLDQEADAGNNLDNHIDIYESSLPIDLSHDIAVNDFAAANPDFSVNPDAELISGPSVIKAMPMFEKLSMGPPRK